MSDGSRIKLTIPSNCYCLCAVRRRLTHVYSSGKRASLPSPLLLCAQLPKDSPVFSSFSSELPSKLSFLANFVNHIYFITFSSIPFLYKIPRKVSWERRKSLKFDFHTDSFPYFILFRKKRNNRTDQSVTNHVLSPRSVCLRGVERSDPRFDICV